MPICSTCGSRQPDGAAFCDECGAALSAPPIASSMAGMGGAPGGIPTVVASLCPVCGAQVAPGELFCNSCGASIGGAPGLPSAAEVPPTMVAPAMAAPSMAAPSMAGPVMAVASCANCGAALEPDSAFCDMCGAPVQAPPAFTPPAPPAYSPPVYPPPASVGEYPPTMMAAPPGPASYPAAAPGQASFPAPPPAPPSYPQPVPQAPAYVPPPIAPRARLVVQGSNVSLPFPVGKTEIIVGREDPVSGVFPDIDLTDHGGDEGGVSRQHARIFIQGDRFLIEDLNSTNFTFVNQQKLAPRQPQPLASGDEVRFGRVKLVFQA